MFLEERRSGLVLGLDLPHVNLISVTCTDSVAPVLVETKPNAFPMPVDVLLLLCLPKAKGFY